MKFHRLEINNITSLKGITVIDFDHILSGEQIFAITGATGSGKSSILAAIALALYGDSHKKSLNNDDFITLGCSVGKAELEFTTSGKKYTACWECRIRKKNGETLKTPKINRYISFDGKILNAKAEEIIGLSFEQFCKTVILNQGEFSRFISSNFSKRRDILEKLYGNEKISIIGRHLSNKIKTIESNAERLQAKMDGALPYDEKEISNFEILFKDLSSKIEQNRKNQIPLNELFNAGKDLIELLSKLDNCKIKEKEHKASLNKTTIDFNNILTQLNKLKTDFQKSESIFQEDGPKLQEALSVQKEIKVSQHYYSDQKELLQNAQDSINLLSNNQKNLLLKISTSKSSIDKIRKQNDLFIQLAPNEIDEISSKITTGKEFFNSLHIINQNLNHFSEDLSSLLKKEEKLIQNYSALKKKQLINQQDISSTKSSEKLQQDLSQLLESKKTLASILVFNESNKKFKHQKEKILFQIEKKDLEHAKTRDLLRKIRFEIDSLDFKHAHQKCLAASLKKHSCVICGANLSGKDLKKKPPFKSVEDLRKEEDGFYQKQMDIEVNLATLVEKSSNVSEKIKLIAEELTNTQRRIESLLKDLGLSSSKEIPSQIKNIENSISQTKILEQKIIEDETQSNELKKQLDEINSDISKCKKRKEKNTIASQDLSNKLSQLTNEIQSIHPPYSQSIQKMSVLFNHDQQALHIFNKETLLLSSLEEHRRTNEDNLKLQNEQLEQTTDRLQNQERKIQQLKRHRHELYSSDNPQEKLNELTTNIKSLKLQCENQQNQVHHKERERDRFNALLETINEQENDINRTLIAIITVSIESARSLSPLLPSDNNLEELKNGLTKIEAIDYQRDLTYNHEHLSLFFQNVLAPYYEQQQLQLKNINDEASHLKLKIEIFHTKQEEQKEMLKKISSINDKLYILKDLDELIGNNEFRNYTLALIEKQLLMYANKELNSLCDGRYEVFQQERRSAQEFYIIDHWKGGLPRKISTLSGGETFLVSLAMALSLADMTRGQTEIDCFYIDEGFGSLDGESIEDALEILSRVRSRGKQIGIISHIESLTDRIPVNILLTKSHFGESIISFNNNSR